MVENLKVFEGFLFKKFKIHGMYYKNIYERSIKFQHGNIREINSKNAGELVIFLSDMEKWAEKLLERF